MKPSIRIALLCVALSAQLFAQDPAESDEKAAPNPNASVGGVLIDPAGGPIDPGMEITVTFPRAMVPAKLIDVAGQPPPIVATPAVDGEFFWKSQTEGSFRVAGVTAGARHHFVLAPALKDASGAPFSVPTWAVDFDAPKFTIAADFEPRRRLSAKPQFSLQASYAVRLVDAAEHIYFQDRTSGERFPAEIINTDLVKPAGDPLSKEFAVSPRDPLPVGREFDIVVNGLVEARSHQPLPYLAVFPAGKTEPLSVEWVGAFNHALEEPCIRIKFNDEIDPAQAKPEWIRIEPAVPGLKLLAESDSVRAVGKFDLKQRYTVAVSPELKGEHGFGLKAESRWAANFRPTEASIVFPASKIFARARNELRFALIQINTPELTWRLAKIPAEKLPAISRRITEFQNDAVDPVTGKPVIDPRTGFTQSYQTELLADAFALPVMSTGKFDGTSGDESVRREVTCAAPANGTFSGPYLLEASAKLPDGRIVGNRSIVCVNDFLLTQKRTPSRVVMRVAKMSDGKPVAGITVRAVTDENIELTRGVTDTDGVVNFDRTLVLPSNAKPAHLFIADTAAGPALQFANTDSYTSGDDALSAVPDTHAEIVSDRNLYRPGQAVKMKGFVRQISGTDLRMPTDSAVQWRVMEAESERVIGEGKATLSAYGSWDSAWTIPESVKLGRYHVACSVGGQAFAGTTEFSIEEYRVPLFSAVVEAKPELGTAAHARVASAYFHGAPNIGARVHWKATWTAVVEITEKDAKRRYNELAELGPRIDPDAELTKTIEGDATLDAQGFATLTCESPFKDNAAISRANLIWKADITSSDGQTLTGGTAQVVDTAAVRLGVKGNESTLTTGAAFSVDAVTNTGTPATDVAVRVDLFHITTKTVKEQIAPFVYRYRNTDQFEKVASRDIKPPADLAFPVTETGRYAAAVQATKVSTPIVSDETFVTGPGEAELPVENDQTFDITHQEKAFEPGEKAVLDVKAPFAGVAWVSVETDDIVDTFLVPVTGNAARIEVPVKKEYAPNATVSVYLVRPGGENELPLERFAFSEIEVRRPDRELKIDARFSAPAARPGDTIRGSVFASSEGKPVANADLVVFAVDDAVLKLGDWSLPDLAKGFFRRNRFGVRTFRSLANYVADITKLKLTQKGFTIGDGGEDVPTNVNTARKEFRTLAFWDANVRTAADGKAAFEFVAPDNLTSYRLVAVGQTKASQFGGDASQTIKISKPLLIDAALPRFLRDGDDVELRAVARQNHRDTDDIELRCIPDANCKLTGSDRATQSAKRDAPAVFRFKAHVTDAALVPTKVRFEAVSKSDGKITDAVEITLPVIAPTVVRKETAAGPFRGPDFDARAAMPDAWKHGRGRFTATVATTPWLPKIAGLPLILDYPHGCFEQISTKLIGYSFLSDLLAYLPDVQGRDAQYRGILERGMKQFSESLLADGTLPYWPGGDTGHGFVTCQALWAVNESVKAGFTPPDGLREKLTTAVTKLVNGQLAAPDFTKPFALFVLSQNAPSEDLHGPAQEIYLRRNAISDEERALLAIALHQLKIMPREQEQLVREIAPPKKERAFNPATFTSVTRAEAMAAIASMTVAPAGKPNEQAQRIRQRMLELMDSSASLSTQENLWLLLAFRSMLQNENAPKLTVARAGDPVLSRNERAAAWRDRNLADPLVLNGLNRAALSFMMTAEYSTDEVNTDRVDRGLRIERVVRNLTDAKRDGSPAAPYRIGDQLLITYRVNTQKLQNYVALEDALPAGIEVVNPNLALVAKFFTLPPADPSDRLLALSHSEMRDRSTLLYFDTIEPGSGTYSVLARATAAGAFRWPATQIVPMYDSRFSGLSPSSQCVVAGE